MINLTVVKKELRKLQRATRFYQEAVLQATYHYLVVQASYSQSDQLFSKQRSDRLSSLQRATHIL